MLPRNCIHLLLLSLFQDDGRPGYSHHIPRVEVVEMIQHWSSHEHLGGHCDLVVNATDYIAEDCGFDSQQLSLKLKITAYPGVMDYGYLVER